LHGVYFMALNMMEDDEMFLVSSFQCAGIAQCVVDPY
jgi:hypothetical protein